MRDALSGRGSTQPGRVRLPKISNNSYTHMNRELIPGR